MTDTVSEVRAAKRAAQDMASLPRETKDRALGAMADALEAGSAGILEQNALDVSDAEGKVSDEMLARLRLTPSKVSDMVASLRDVAAKDDPVGETISATELDRDLVLYKVRCPIGVIGVIFESRPDVVPQIMSLCLKSGNSVVFKGGVEARRSNRALFDLLRSAAASAGVPPEAFVLMESRSQVAELLKMDDLVDLLVPRGSYKFVRYIQENTRIPVLGHSSGVCHVYVDEKADMEKAFRVALDSKIQYPAACNAAEKLLVNEKVARYFLPRMADLFAANGVEMRVDKRCMFHLLGFDVKEATEADWTAEYDAKVIAIRMVGDLDEAVGIINANGSHHTDCIVTEDREAQREFVRRVDSADVFVNASTRFADGYRFGLGAEVGISTGKIHARGPMGMEGLTTYKYVLIGDGQAVKDYTGPGARKYTHRKLDLRYGERR